VSFAPAPGMEFSPIQSVAFTTITPLDGEVEVVDPKDSAYAILYAYCTGAKDAALTASTVFLLQNLHNQSPEVVRLCDIMRSLSVEHTLTFLWGQLILLAMPK
jgi:hypothetical protein